LSISRSESRKIAARYVSAFFDVALQNKKQEVVGSDFINLAEVISGNNELRDILRNPMIAAEQKVAALKEIAKKLKAHKQTIEFIEFLGTKNRLECLIDVVDLYKEKLIDYNGEVTAQIITAKAISAKAKSKLEKSLEKTVGKKIIISELIDESIIG